ncbi:MAG: NAD(P)/FAD-dependent oxidoreductase [Eubacterium sp.]|nr:NAD(P)/FAD-dependent oxidoreductase [Eubacterium sp.]
MLQSDKYDVCVIGGGASGMMAAVFSARKGKSTVIIEKNEKLGKKLFITGKGRCNFTNSCDTEDFFSQVVTNAKFLYSCIYGFSNFDVIDFFEKLGLKTKVERGGRVFPASDKSSDVIKALKNACDEAGVKVLLNTEVDDVLVLTDDSKESDSQQIKSVTGVKLTDGTKIFADKVIIATGGISYPSTGSTGDGYTFAAKTGHNLVPAKPGLTGLCTKERWTSDLAGLTLNNCGYIFKSKKSGKTLHKDFGELLFTHFGVSGPCVLSASSLIGDRICDGEVSLIIDLKPALDEGKLDKRLIREIEGSGKKSVKHMLHTLLPSSMLEVFCDICGIDAAKRASFITKDERKSIVNSLKCLELTPTSLRNVDEAIITRGGVDVRDIEPHTMQSRLVNGLYFAGEVIDTDALTGGYNLQIAWSTGALAGKSV